MSYGQNLGSTSGLLGRHCLKCQPQLWKGTFSAIVQDRWWKTGSSERWVFFSHLSVNVQVFHLSPLLSSFPAINNKLNFWQYFYVFFPQLYCRMSPQNFSPSVFLFIVFYCSSGLKKYMPRRESGNKMHVLCSCISRI